MNKKNKFNFTKWSLIVVAILSLLSIIVALIEGEASLLVFICAELQVIIISLFSALILHMEGN